MNYDVIKTYISRIITSHLSFLVFFTHYDVIIQFKVSSQLGELYKMAETDTLINFFSKLAIRSNRDTSPQKLKEGTLNFDFFKFLKIPRHDSTLLTNSRRLPKTLFRSELNWSADSARAAKGKI